MESAPNCPVPDKILNGHERLDVFAQELSALNRGIPSRVNTGPEQVERGLAKLVLMLIELLRQLMERQAVHRIDGGSLTDDEIERLGQTFMKLESRMDELKKTFGLSDDDLKLSLGPLGDLI
jgi:hypothetical protein